MRILFVFPNIDCGGYKPVGLTTLMNICRKTGHEVSLFDTSFIQTKEILHNKNYAGITEAGIEILNFPPVDLSSYNLRQEPKKLDIDFLAALKSFNPEVIAISSLSVEWKLSLFLAETVKKYDENIFVVLGGVHAYADPAGAIEPNCIDAICIGEGEIPLPTLLDRLATGTDYENTDGFWIKKNGKTHKNKIGNVFLKLDSLPYLDYDFYDDRLMYRVYDGKVYRSGDHVITRGCYGKCSYCLYDKMHEINKDNWLMGRYTPHRIIEELSYLKQKYDLNFYRFQDASFLTISTAYIRELSELYSKKIGLPFVVDVSPETVTNEKVRFLRDMGCVSVSVGVETGNEKMRFEVCNKPVKNEVILKAFSILNNAGLRTVSFLMMGFPTETRKHYFDTINLVKEAKVKAPAIGFVYPFVGSKLRGVAIKLGLFNEEDEKTGRTGYSRGVPSIKNPNITEEEYRGMIRAFALYAKFPQKYWAEIAKTETFNEEGQRIYAKFAEIYTAENLYNDFWPEEKILDFK